MEINVITIFPGMFKAVTGYGMIRQAIQNGSLALNLLDLRDFSLDRHRAVDDRPYGGGPGMIMSPEPLTRCLEASKKMNSGPVVYLTPQGKRFSQAMAREFSSFSGMTLLAGRYEGIDERIVVSQVDLEVSVGDYVLSGGEIPAMVLIDAISRLLPGVLGNELSVLEDSFSADLLDCPQYTRPKVFEGQGVPEVLLSGNHEKIRQWRMKQSQKRTLTRRPDLLDRQKGSNLCSD